MLVMFGFNVKWKPRICACVFSRNFMILDNGYPTQEITIQKGLNQGDPLALFLFLLTVEGLNELFSRAMISIF